MSHKDSVGAGPVRGRTLFVGIAPQAFEPGDLPDGLTPEILAARIEAGQSALEEAGIDAEHCMIGKDPDEAEAMLREAFGRETFPLAMIGAGIRALVEHTLLFERIVNVLIELNPSIRLCFNTSPEDTINAIRRWTEG